MATIKTFFKLHGNDPIEKVPFCETDILVLNCLSYCAFINTPEFKEEMKNKFFLFSTFNNKDSYKILAEPFLTPGNEYVDFLEVFFKCERYKDLKFGHVLDHFSKKDEAQFFGMTFKFKNNLIIVFRGTDNSIIGWKEDFNMALLDTIPAQELSKKYVEKIAKKLRGNFYISGHSKGGNLSYYSFFNVNDEIKKRVIKVYNLDGPGFRNDPYDYSLYEDKLLKIVPNDDIVGCLFDNSGNHKIAGSTKIGVFAHDLLTWNLDRQNGCLTSYEVKNLTPFSRAFKLTINDWFYNYSSSYVKEMTDFIFRFLEVNNRNTLGEIVKDFLLHGYIFTSEFDKISGDTKEIVYKMSKDFIKLYIKNLFSNDNKMLKKFSEII